MSITSRLPTRARSPRRWRNKNGLVIPTSEAIAEAMASVPDGPPWTWAALRVMPSIRGLRVPLIDNADLEDAGFAPISDFPTVAMPPGVDVMSSIDVEVMSIHINQEHLDRWDKSIEDVTVAAMANLRRTVGTWDGRAFDDDSLDGVVIRQLSGWPHWAASLLLVPDELKRIFGPDDQLFLAPYHCNLMSLPIEVDRDFAADLVDMFGLINPRSILMGLPAFVLRGGDLSTEELPGSAEHPEGAGNPEAAGDRRLASLLGW